MCTHIVLFTKRSKTTHNCLSCEQYNILLWCFVNVYMNTNKYYVFYRPPSTSITELQTLPLKLHHLAAMHNCCSTIIIGDFNENLNNNYTPISQVYCSEGFKQLISHPTTKSGSTIDLIFAKTTMPAVAGVLRTHFSVHHATYAMFCCNATTKGK